MENKVKACQHCHTPFLCQAADISNCQCQHIQLTTEQLHILSTMYNDCLCANCLAALSKNELVKSV